MTSTRPENKHQHQSSLFRTLRAILRDTFVILRETGSSLLAFVVIWLVFGGVLWIWYQPGGVQRGLVESLYTALAQLLFQPQPLPQQLALQIMFFLAPAVGLILVGRGALQAAVLLFDKRTRGEAWQMALASTYTNHIIVCGLGKVGYRVVIQLRSVGQEVVVVQRTADAEFVPLIRGLGVPVVIGDARQTEVLLSAGLMRAHSVSIVTNDDLTNLDIALTCREQRPGVPIVMRVFNDALARKLSSAFNIKAAFSTSALAAPTFAAAAIDRDISNAIYVGGKFLVTLEVTVMAGGALDNQAVGEIEQAHDVSILYRRNKGGEDLRPRTDERLKGGDLIVVIGLLEVLQRLQTLNDTVAQITTKR